MHPSIVILTFNSCYTIAATLLSVKSLSDDIHIVDSYSTDETLTIAKRFGAHIVQRPFVNYADQRNWAIANLPLRYPWQLHLDADERLSDGLVKEIIELSEKPHADGFLIPRLTHFLGKPIKHGGHNPVYHMRLFRNGAATVEARLYDQHFLLNGQDEQLHNLMIDDIRLSLSQWTERHNRWSDFEAEDAVRTAETGETIAPGLWNPIRRRRLYRSIYGRLPLGVRPFLLFFYRYIIRFGFLDGQHGFFFFALQTLWFRLLVDAKIYERRRHLDDLN